MDSARVFAGAVALELVPGAQPARTRLAREAAGRCGAGIANDLARLLPDTAELDLAVAGVLLDPAELLRPGWPVHAALDALLARAPGAAGGRVLAFGMRDSRMADPALEPSPELAGGPLRLLPWLLSGPHAKVAAVGERLEELLLERGMAEAATALALQDAFGAALEHVRLATLHDLCALTAAQYRHAALEGTWSVIEAALLQPGAGQFADSDGPPLLFQDGRAWMGTLDAHAWAEATGSGTAGARGAVAGVAPGTAWQYWQMRERQIAAVLAAHGLPVTAVALPSLRQARVLLQAAAGAG